MTSEDPRVRSVLKELKRAEHLMRIWTAGVMVVAVIQLSVIGYIGFRWPAASLPALVAAALALFTSRMPPTNEEFGRIMRWGIIGGATGYGALAAFGVGVPAPDAPLRWRLFGGLVFGGVAGVAASLIVWQLAIFLKPKRYLPKPGPRPDYNPRLRSLIRWAAAILGTACAVTSVAFVVVGLSTFRDEGVLSLAAWKESMLFFLGAFGEGFLGLIFLRAAWTGKNPSSFEAVDRGIDVPPA